MVEVNKFGNMNCEHPTSSMFAKSRRPLMDLPLQMLHAVMGLPLGNKAESNAIPLQLHVLQSTWCTGPVYIACHVWHLSTV